MSSVFNKESNFSKWSEKDHNAFSAILDNLPKSDIGDQYQNRNVGLDESEIDFRSNSELRKQVSISDSCMMSYINNEPQNLVEALKWANKSVELAPLRAGSYNNRAVVYRQFQTEEKDKLAMLDLEKAIELSKGKGMAGKQAYNQRASMKIRDGDKNDALVDLHKSAGMGDKWAKNLIVQCNDMQKLCGQAVNEMMKQYQIPESDEI